MVEEERLPLQAATAARAGVELTAPGAGSAGAAPPVAAPEPRGDKDIAAFAGYRSPLWRRLLFYTLAACTGGLLLLLCRWYLTLRVWLTLEPCWLGEADVVLVTLVDTRQELVTVTRLPSLTAVRITASSGAADGYPAANGFPAADGGGAKGDADGPPGHAAAKGAPASQFLLHEGEALLDAPPAPAAAPPAKGDGDDRLLLFRCGRYLFSPAEQTFLPVPALPKGFPAQLAALAAAPGRGPRPADELERGRREALFGPNELRIPTPTVPALLLEEAIHPFFLFQYLSVLIWCLGRYFSYSAVIIAMTLSSILANAVSAYRYRRRLAALAHYRCEVEVVGPGGRPATRDSASLIPGDVVVLHPGLLPCDLVLLRGEAIVDEAMLTGESVPVRKVAYSPEGDGGYHPDTAKTCTLYGGTTVAQVRPGGPEGAALAVVCRTGFAQAKGQLFKSILFPRQHRQTFVSDALKFIAAMLVLGMGFYVWDIVALVRHGANAGFIVLKYFDLLTIAVPPALPACLTVATAIAVRRLERHEIFCSEPSAINVAGMLDVICFDKTGTLTEPGLQLKGVVPSRGAEGGFGLLCAGAALPAPQAEVLATCHGLARLDAGLGGELVGDPLDQQLWEATGWEMLDEASPPQPAPRSEALEVVATPAGEPGGEPGNGGGGHVTSVGAPGTPRVPGTPGMLTTAHVSARVRRPGGGVYTVLRRFEFCAERQRNSVVVRRPDGTLFVACKGSPEAIAKLSVPASLPADFEGELGRHTREGLRVIALAARPLAGLSEGEVAGLSQDAAEAGLAFLGFAVMVNPLRSDTTEALVALQAAGIRCVMCTGDHARTAVSVAHACGLLCRHKAVAVADTARAEGSVADAGLTVSVVAEDGSAGAPGDPAAILADVAADVLDAAATGRGFEKLRQVGGLDTVLLKAGVFARMAPDDKRLLVELLGDGTLDDDGREEPGLGHHVGFCGDGANDVGALKAAHVGVSLCEAEASVAAPLTSKRQTIACMLAVVAEGRASLATSYAVFQFVISYAFIQVFGVALLYSIGSSVGNWQYLIQDLMYTTLLAALMGLTLPARKLTPQRPPDRLLSLGVWLPVAAQLLLCAGFQLLALAMLVRQDWHAPFEPAADCFTVGGANSPHCSRSPENSAVFLMSLAQFLITALVYNRGGPFRRALYTNTWLVMAMCAQTLFLLFLLLAPSDALTESVAGLVPFPAPFRGRLLLLVLLNLGGAYLADLLATFLWQAIRGRRCCGMTIL